MPITKNACNELKRRSRDHFLITFNEIFGTTKEIVLKMLAVFEAEITLKKCLPLGTNISWFCILSRVERDQERKNRMGKSFFMHISFNYIKKGGGGGFKIRYRNLFLGPASERNKLERWGWFCSKALFL